jgi:hypothetical protein
MIRNLILILILPTVAFAQPQNVDYRIPYRLSDTKHIIVRVKINGKGPFSFILDTGSPAFIVSEVVAKKAGGLPVKDDWSVAETVDIEGGLKLKDVRIRVWDPFQLKHMNAAGLADADIAGVLGYSLIGRFKIDIDLKRRHMLWTDSGKDPEMPAALDITGGKPIRAGQEVGELDRLAANARSFLPAKKNQVARGRGFIGIEIEDSDKGVRVTRVAPGSPAAKAGLAAGDLIRKATLGGEADSIEKSDQLITLASDLSAGKRLFLVAERDGRVWKTAIIAARGAL